MPLYNVTDIYYTLCQANLGRLFSSLQFPSVACILPPNEEKMPTRLKDLAERLNLSISTVSAALKNRSDISPTTRRRVWNKAKEMNYRPNWVARSLVTRKTQVLGVIVPDLSRSFFTEVTKGIDEVTSEKGYHLVICNTGEDAVREEEELMTLISKRVDGLIVASAQKPGTKGVGKQLAKTGIPFVLVDRFFPRVDFVGGDDKKIGYLATEHLISQQYKNIAHIRGPHISTAIGRYQGYMNALRRHGLSMRRDYVIEAHYHEESSGYQSMRKLLEVSRRPDAIFAASDPIAIGALQAILEAKLRLPEDMGLIGVGNARYGQYLSVSLSTVDQNRVQIGRTAANLLLRRIQKSAPSQPQIILIDPTLVIRESSNRDAKQAKHSRQEEMGILTPLR